MSDNEKICEMPLPDFLNKAADEKNWDILIGNGLGLALGEIDPLFKEVFSFNSYSITKVLLEEMNGKDKDLVHGFENPELFLEYVRLKTLLEISHTYQNNFSDQLKEKIKNIHCNIIKDHNFINYISINYNPILYVNLIKNKKINDGFKKGGYFGYDGEFNFISIHGAYFLYRESEEKQIRHKKISKDGFKYLIEACLDKFSRYRKSLEEYFYDSINKNYPSEAPLIIMEDRPEIKKSIIISDNYLKIGYDHLENKSLNIFTFGCSFTYDAHLLGAIFSGEGKTIALGHYGDEEKKRFQSYVKERNKNQHHTVWLIETESFDKFVWEKK